MGYYPAGIILKLADKMLHKICKGKIMTPKEIVCLIYLSNKMEATAEMIGEKIITDFYTLGTWSSKYIKFVGGGILASLYKKKLVYRLPELNAWRLTKKGREIVNDMAKDCQ